MKYRECEILKSFSPADNLRPSSTSTSATTTTTSTATLKRRREEDGVVDAQEAGNSTDVPTSQRRLKATQDIIYWIVVSWRQIGKVIGRVDHRDSEDGGGGRVVWIITTCHYLH
ncbi:hypothetical protein Salat_0202800 [Sesamum alatum]|uniref:Uncharacterized protein n=1 Tax=Sesamum alatum TaxID=300844 RepID=A0AAE1YZ95_9LAMI|nr:hypothetical protein Salat_0202800 [Sesamum alatum]